MGLREFDLRSMAIDGRLRSLDAPGPEDWAGLGVVEGDRLSRPQREAGRRVRSTAFEKPLGRGDMGIAAPPCFAKTHGSRRSLSFDEGVAAEGHCNISKRTTKGTRDTFTSDRSA
jgi:hypothetical protein